jgi:hypothetical protein
MKFAVILYIPNHKLQRLLTLEINVNLVFQFVKQID